MRGWPCIVIGMQPADRSPEKHMITLEFTGLLGTYVHHPSPSLQRMFSCELLLSKHMLLQFLLTWPLFA